MSQRFFQPAVIVLLILILGIQIFYVIPSLECRKAIQDSMSYAELVGDAFAAIQQSEKNNDQLFQVLGMMVTAYQGHVLTLSKCT